jgi:hypothetical protein
MNPRDWAATIMMKTTTGEYYTGGPFASIQAPTLWGLPVAFSPVVPAGTAIVGAFQQGAQVFWRGGIRVEASNSHADFFIRNLVAIRAERRFALCVYRPAAFAKVTNLNSAPTLFVGSGATPAAGAARGPLTTGQVPTPPGTAIPATPSHGTRSHIR